MLVGLQCLTPLVLLFQAENSTLGPHVNLATSASLAGRLGPRLCKNGPPLL